MKYPGLLYRKEKDQSIYRIRRQKVGTREVEDKIWLVSFMKYDIGFFDEMGNRVEPTTNPFDVIVLPMSSV